MNEPEPWARLHVTVPVGVLGVPGPESTTLATQVTWVLTGPVYVEQATVVVVARVPTGNVVLVDEVA